MSLYVFSSCSMNVFEARRINATLVQKKVYDVLKRESVLGRLR